MAYNFFGSTSLWYNTNGGQSYYYILEVGCDGGCLAGYDDFGNGCELIMLGCTDDTACNYDASANTDNSGCIYPAQYYDCNNVCINDADGDGVCDENYNSNNVFGPGDGNGDGVVNLQDLFSVLDNWLQTYSYSEDMTENEISATLDSITYIIAELLPEGTLSLIHISEPTRPY